MLTRRNHAVFLLVAAVLVLSWAFAGKAGAAEVMSGKVELHGYGDTGFRLTNRNPFLGANSSGSWNAQAALLVSANVADDTTIWTQVFGNEDRIRLDWAFVDYRISNSLAVRGGQIKTPIGIYNEIRDIRYLHLSTIEPYIYQESADIADEAFRGASVIYADDLAGGNVEATLYGGQSVAFGDDPATHNQMVGGRIIYSTPLDGLRLMGSGFTAKAEEEDNKGHANMFMGSIDYLHAGIDLKAEYAYMKILGEEKQAYYAQAGYTFFEKLTPFVRYDYITTDRENRSDPSFYQKGVVVGIGYKINSSVALKFEDHFIKGFALPVASGEVAAGEGNKNWNLFAAGINFMF